LNSAPLASRWSLGIPEDGAVRAGGSAHGFQTLKESAEVSLSDERLYHADAELGVRLNDPPFDIKWPIEEAPFRD
jgi:dTDP-4-dehydrorhamnose 3,5-epimerase-like enzyme